MPQSEREYIEKHLRDHGWAVQAVVVNSCDFGAASSKNRLYFMALKGNTEKHRRLLLEGDMRGRTRKDAVSWPDCLA